MCVHHIERHLDCIKREVAGKGRLQHLEMNVGALVSGETDVPDLTLLPRVDRCLQAACASPDKPVMLCVARNVVETRSNRLVARSALGGSMAQKFKGVMQSPVTPLKETMRDADPRKAAQPQDKAPD